jgi:hypothetical protein
MWPRELIACATQCDTATATSVASAVLRARQTALSVGRFVVPSARSPYRLEAGPFGLPLGSPLGF